VSLIVSPRHTAEDLRAWGTLARFDAVLALRPSLARATQAAQSEIAQFIAQGPAYVGVSWGKDSVVVAHLARLVSADIPLVWVRVGNERENPDCVLVRDAFMARFPGAYDEILVDAPEAGTGSLARGGEIAGGRYGHRYVSGVRAEESRTRALRVATYGLSTDSTCAPIGRWSGVDVFAYLARYDLPVHPAYACTYGGVLDRCRVRVAPTGGDPGRGHGRAEWERAYYGPGS